MRKRGGATCGPAGGSLLVPNRDFETPGPSRWSCPWAGGAHEPVTDRQRVPHVVPRARPPRGLLRNEPGASLGARCPRAEPRRLGRGAAAAAPSGSDRQRCARGHAPSRPARPCPPASCARHTHARSTGQLPAVSRDSGLSRCVLRLVCPGRSSSHVSCSWLTCRGQNTRCAADSCLARPRACPERGGDRRGESHVRAR